MTWRYIIKSAVNGDCKSAIGVNMSVTDANGEAL